MDVSKQNKNYKISIKGVQNISRETTASPRHLVIAILFFVD